MNKVQSNNQQFQTRTGSFATHGSRTGLNLLGWECDESMTDAQKRDALCVAKRNIVQKIIEAKAILSGKIPDKQRYQLIEHRKSLALKMVEIESQLKEFKAVLKPNTPDLGEIIINLVRERMTKQEWKNLLTEANRRFELQGDVSQNFNLNVFEEVISEVG